MSVSGISSNYNSYDQYNTAKLSPGQMQKQFESLGSALSSGDMTTAKSILTTMQQNAPSGANSAGSNQISSDMEKLSSAINSGDQQSALDAYNSIKSNISQMKQSARPSGMPPGQARGGQGQAPGKSVSSSSSNTSSTSSSDSSSSASDSSKLKTLAAEGMSASEIAQQLGMSVSQVMQEAAAAGINLDSSSASSTTTDSSKGSNIDTVA